MIFLGLLLVILGAGAAILVFTEEGTGYDVFGYTFQPDHIEMFLAGAAASATLLLGLWLITLGSRRAARQRRALRGARADASHRVAELEKEKRRLQERLDKEQETSRRAAVDEPTERRTVTDQRAATAADPGDDRLVAGRAEETRR